MIIGSALFSVKASVWEPIEFKHSVTIKSIRLNKYRQIIENASLTTSGNHAHLSHAEL